MPTPLAISGIVTAPAGPLGGIELTLTNPGSDNEQDTTTASDGSFSFANLSQGLDYVVTPSSQGYVFSPAAHQYLPLTTDIAASDFSATPLTISGRTLQTGKAPKPLGGCLVQLADVSGNTQVTTSDPTTGRYIFATGLEIGHSYLIQATKDGYTPVLGPLPIELGSPIERDLYLSADPHESVVTTWLLHAFAIAGPIVGVTSLGWAVYTYLHPNLPPGADPAAVLDAAGEVNLGQAVDAAAANNVISAEGAVAARAAANTDLPLTELTEPAASTMVNEVRSQVTSNMAQDLVDTLMDTNASNEAVVQSVSSIGGEESPAVVDALITVEDSNAALARLQTAFQTCLDIPDAAPDLTPIAVGESGWAGAVFEATASGSGATVEITELAQMLPLAGETIEASALSIEGVADVLIGLIALA